MSKLVAEFEGQKYQLLKYAVPEVGDVVLLHTGELHRATVPWHSQLRAIFSTAQPKADLKKVLLSFEGKTYQVIAYRCPKARELYLYDGTQIDCALIDFDLDKHSILQEVESSAA